MLNSGLLGGFRVNGGLGEPTTASDYEVVLTATDSAGNTASGTCKIAIISGCTPGESGCKKRVRQKRDRQEVTRDKLTPRYFSTRASPIHPNAELFYIERSIVDEVLNAESPTLYEVAEEELVWKAQEGASLMKL